MSFVDMEKLSEREPIPGFRGRFVHTSNMTMAYWTVSAEAVAPEHRHPHEQVLSVIEGRFEFNLEGETRVLGAGDVAAIPPDAPHSGKALTECRLLDVFHPVRIDLK